MNEKIMGSGSHSHYEIARCIFCLTGYEQQIVDSINEGQLAKAIYPVKTKRIRSKGVWQEITSPLLPGRYPISHRLCCGLISQCYVDMGGD